MNCAVLYCEYKCRRVHTTILIKNSSFIGTWDRINDGMSAALQGPVRRIRQSSNLGVKLSQLCLGFRRRSVSSQPPNFPVETPRRIIFGSCSDSSLDLSYFDTFRSLAPDLVILMGDNVYGRSSTLKEEYKKLVNHPSFRRAKQELCLLATLDDNDYGNHSGGGGGSGSFIESPDDAILLFSEVFKPNLANKKGVYQSYEWKDQLQILLLDLRYFGSRKSSDANHPGVAQHPDCRIMDNVQTWLGRDQWLWLEQELNKEFQLRLIISPLQVLSTCHTFECWNVVPQERMRLLTLLQGKRSLLLSGDRHVSALYGTQDGAHYEITSSSLTHSVPHGLLDEEVDWHRKSHFTYENNFGMLELGQDTTVVASIRSTKTANILQQWQLNVS
jgi:alkaline phosphatase D